MPVITIQAYPLVAASHPPSPIAMVGTAFCDSTGGGRPCLSRDVVKGPGGSQLAARNQYYAVEYPTPQARIKVGIYPSDICDAYQAATGGAATGCSLTTPSVLNTPVAGVPVKMVLA